VSGRVPVAATVNVAVCPEAIVWLAGWVVMVGALVVLTVIVAVLLLTLVPMLSVTFTQ
jgi:hypothetical protein